MGFTGLSPIELLVCGLLAAGLAYVMYKCGGFGKKKSTVSAAKLHARSLEQWSALTKRANQRQMAELFHSNPCSRQLDGRSPLTMREARASGSSGSNSTMPTTSSCSSGCICCSARVHGDYSNRRRTARPNSWDDDSRSFASRIYRFNDSEMSELDKCTSSYANFCTRSSFPSFPKTRPSYAAPPTTQPDPSVPSTSTANMDASSEDLSSESFPKMDSIPMKPEMKSQFQNLSQNVSELVTKVEEQRHSLGSVLREVRGNLDVVCKEPAEVKERAQRAEVDGQEEEQQQEKVEQQDEAKERQEEEEEDEENSEHSENGHQVQNLHELLADIADLNVQIKRMREEMRARNLETVEMHNYLYSVCQASRALISEVLEVAAGSEDCELDELMDMLNVPNASLLLDPAPQITNNVQRHQLD